MHQTKVVRPEILCMRGDCNNVIRNDYSYCFEHKCVFYGCFRARQIRFLPGAEKFNKYCQEHECEYDECYNLRKKGKSVCHEHVCSSDECNKYRYAGSKYCKQHKCIFNSCLNENITSRTFLSVANYCYQHRCTYCKNKVTDINSKVCSVHTCECGNPREGLKKYCEKHFSKIPIKCQGCFPDQIQFYPYYCIMHEPLLKKCAKEIQDTISCKTENSGYEVYILVSVQIRNDDNCSTLYEALLKECVCHLLKHTEKNVANWDYTNVLSWVECNAKIKKNEGIKRNKGIYTMKMSFKPKTHTWFFTPFDRYYRCTQEDFTKYFDDILNKYI